MRRHHSRASRFEPLFEKGRDGLDDIPAAVYRGQHEHLTEKFVGRKNAQEKRQGGAVFAPDSPSSPSNMGSDTRAKIARGSGSTEATGKDELHPPRRQGAGSLLSAAGKKKSAQERYAEMAQPWIANLQKVLALPLHTRDIDQFSDCSSPASPAAEVFLHSNSAPSPKKREDEIKSAKTEEMREDADQVDPPTFDVFARVRSAPESGYIDDVFSRIPPHVSEVSTYTSLDPLDFDIVPEAQLNCGLFKRSQSAPSPLREMSDEEPNATAHHRTPRSKELQARSNTNSPLGKSLRAKAKQPAQSAEEAANALVKQGLLTEWSEAQKLPWCVAEKLSARLNWDDAFVENMPGKVPENGVYSPKNVQQDFAGFLERRDVMLVNLVTQMQAPSASHVLRYFTTNSGTALLRKNGGAVVDVVEGVHIEDRDLTPSVQAALDASYNDCRSVQMQGGISLIENMLHPAEHLDEEFDSNSSVTADFCVFRHLDAKLGRSIMYKHMKYKHYIGWIMVQRPDKLSKNTYQVQFISAFSACLVKTQVSKVLPFAIRPVKNFSTQLIYYMFLDKYERNLNSIRAQCGTSASSLGSLAVSLGVGKHFR